MPFDKALDSLADLSKSVRDKLVEEAYKKTDEDSADKVTPHQKVESSNNDAQAYALPTVLLYEGECDLDSTGDKKPDAGGPVQIVEGRPDTSFRSAGQDGATENAARELTTQKQDGQTFIFNAVDLVIQSLMPLAIQNVVLLVDEPDTDWTKNMSVKNASSDPNSIDRIVTIAGKDYELTYKSHWWYGGNEGDPNDLGPAKVHVCVSGAADLGRVQAVLIPALVDHPELKELVLAWKTLDPNCGIGVFDKNDSRIKEPSGKGQRAKGFTIFTTDVDAAKKIQKIVDKILTENGLGLKQPLETGNVDNVLKGERTSNRVGIVRDYYYPANLAENGTKAIQIDLLLGEYIKAKMGAGPDDRLTDGPNGQLREVERMAGLKPFTLTYDSFGELALVLSTDAKPQKINGMSLHYVTETGTDKTHGSLTDRPAIYALANTFLPAGLDPIDLLSDEHPLPDTISAARPPDNRSNVKFGEQTISLAPGEEIPLRINVSVNFFDGPVTTPAPLIVGRDLDGKYYIRQISDVAETQVKLNGQTQQLKRGTNTPLHPDAEIYFGNDQQRVEFDKEAVRRASTPQAAAPEVPLHPGEELGLDRAIDNIPAEGLLTKDGKVNRTRVLALLSSTLTEIDNENGWKLDERESFNKLKNAYRNNDPEAVAKVHKELKLPTADAIGAIPNGPLPTDNLRAASTACTPEAFAAHLQEIRRSGIVFEALRRAEMSDEKARELEIRLTSENEEIRKKAVQELYEKYKVTDIERVMKSRSGGAGAWAIVIERVAAAFGGGNSGTPPPRPRGK